MTDNAGWAVTGSVQLRFPIADGGAARARVARAELSVEAAGREVVRATTETHAAAAALFDTVARARAAAESAAARAALVERRLEQARTMHAEGLISALDFSETELVAERTRIASRQAERARYVVEFETLVRLGY